MFIFEFLTTLLVYVLCCLLTRIQGALSSYFQMNFKWKHCQFPKIDLNQYLNAHLSCKCLFAQIPSKYILPNQNLRLSRLTPVINKLKNVLELLNLRPIDKTINIKPSFRFYYNYICDIKFLSYAYLSWFQHTEKRGDVFSRMSCTRSVYIYLAIFKQKLSL